MSAPASSGGPTDEGQTPAPLPSAGSAGMSDESPRSRLPPLRIPAAIPAHLRPDVKEGDGAPSPRSSTTAGPSSAATRAQRARTGFTTPVTPGGQTASPSTPTSNADGGVASANRRRAHSIGVSLRPRSSSRTGGIQGLTTSYGLGSAVPNPGPGATPASRLAQGDDIAEQSEDGHEADTGNRMDVLDMAERGATQGNGGVIGARRTSALSTGPDERPLGGEATSGSGHSTPVPSQPATAGKATGRRRGSSIVDRIRNSIESRDRRDSLGRHSEAGPVEYEVVHDGRGREDGVHEDLDDGVVGMLDVVDAEVSTVNHLQNVTNSIFLPHFPALWSRRPEIVIEHDRAAPTSSAVQRTGPARADAPLLNTAFEGSDSAQTATQAARTAPTTSRRSRASTVAGLYPPSPVTSSASGPRPAAGHGGSLARGLRPTLPRILSQPSPQPTSPDLPSPTLGTETAGQPALGDIAEVGAAHDRFGQDMMAGDARHVPGGDAVSKEDPLSDRVPEYTAHSDALSTHSQQSLIGANDLAGKHKALHAHDHDDAESSHELDLHVRQALKASKRERIKKGLKGLWVFLKTPMGFVVGVYGVLVVFWGAALVIILAGWIPMPNKWWQDRWVEICSQIVNGLFTITGVGLIPWRVQDTYRMIIISSLKRRTHIKRRKARLPPIEDPNDIPDPKEQEDYVSVLTEREQARLTYQQEKFALSQTWYRPHATATHKAFPITWALWNTVLMDLNSVFQCILCGCMWGLNQYQRPAWTTGSLIPLSFLCGIGAGVLIWQGSARTKKRETVEDKLRAALGVPLAIALPQTKDGTFITGNNKALIGRKPRRPSSGDGSRSASPIPLNQMSERSDKGDTDSEGDADPVLHDNKIKRRDGREQRSSEKAGEDRVEEIDGTVPLRKIVSPSMDRRATVTLGSVPDDLAPDVGDANRRERGQTIGHVEELKGI